MTINLIVKNRHKWEKNWVLFNYKNSIHVIYKWYPLHICKLNDEKLELVEIKELPDFFCFCRGSTCGYEYEDKIWFVIHKTTYLKNYFHIIVIFDKNMNLIAYTNLLKFENYSVEFCIAIIVEKENIIMTYSTDDITSKIAIYDKNYIMNLLIYV